MCTQYLVSLADKRFRISPTRSTTAFSPTCNHIRMYTHIMHMYILQYVYALLYVCFHFVRIHVYSASGSHQPGLPLHSHLHATTYVCTHIYYAHVHTTIRVCTFICVFPFCMYTCALTGIDNIGMYCTLASLHMYCMCTPNRQTECLTI